MKTTRQIPFPSLKVLCSKCGWSTFVPPWDWLGEMSPVYRCVWKKQGNPNFVTIWKWWEHQTTAIANVILLKIHHHDPWRIPMGRLVHLLLYTFISDKLILMGYPLHLPIHLYCRLIYGTSHNDPCNIILYIFTDPWMVDVFYVFFLYRCIFPLRVPHGTRLHGSFAGSRGGRTIFGPTRSFPPLANWWPRRWKRGGKQQGVGIGLETLKWRVRNWSEHLGAKIFRCKYKLWGEIRFQKMFF